MTITKHISNLSTTSDIKRRDKLADVISKVILDIKKMHEVAHEINFLTFISCLVGTYVSWGPEIYAYDK